MKFAYEVATVIYQWYLQTCIFYADICATLMGDDGRLHERLTKRGRQMALMSVNSHERFPSLLVLLVILYVTLGHDEMHGWCAASIGFINTQRRFTEHVTRQHCMFLARQSVSSICKCFK